MRSPSWRTSITASQQVKPQYAPPRVGDVRHSTADISLARATLGYEPLVAFEDGLRRTVEWLRAVLPEAG